MVRDFLIKHIYLINQIAKNITLFIVALFILEWTNLLNVHKFVSLKSLYATAIAFATIWFLLIYRESSNKTLLKNIIKYIFMTLLLFLLLSIHKWEAISWLNEQLLNLQFYITTLFIAVGIILFWLYREKVNDNEERQEEEQEQYRKKEFDNKYPFFGGFNISYNIIRYWKENKYILSLQQIILSPFIFLSKLVYYVIRWMYSEGWVYSGLLIGIILLGFTLRIWNIGYLAPAGDEFRHLIAAKRYLTEGFFQYPGIISTWLIIIVKKIFNTSSLFLMRLPFVMAGTISIVFMYNIGKLFSKKAGVAAAYLLAFLPLSIGISGYIRNYEILLMIFIIFLYYILRNKGTDKKFFITLVYVAGLLALINIGDYSEWVQTIDLLILIITATYIFSIILNKYVKNDLSNIIIRLFLSIVTFIIGAHLIPVLTHLSLKETPTLQYLFFLNYHHTTYLWYLQFIPYIIVLILITFPVFYNIKESRIYSLVFTFLFASYTFIFYFSAPRTFQPRYFYIFMPLIILLISVSFNYIYKIIKNNIITKNNFSLIVPIILFLLIFNPYNAVNNTITTKKGEFSKNNGLAYYDSKSLFDFLIDNNLSEERILTTQPYVFDYYFDRPFLKEKNKPQYIYFPKDQWYEYLDRTQGYYAINGYWGVNDIKRVKQIIDENNITLLVFHALPKSNISEYGITTVLNNYPDFELVRIIGKDNYFGYYILKKY